MVDPTSLQPGQRVRVWVTGRLGHTTAEVTDKHSYGVPVLRVDDETSGLVGCLLKHEDYGIIEVLVARQCGWIFRFALAFEAAR